MILKLKRTPGIYLLGFMSAGKTTIGQLLAHELGVRESVEFVTDAPWAEILDWLGRSSVGVNGMWNEHFGIGVVEYQAAGDQERMD